MCGRELWEDSADLFKGAGQGKREGYIIKNAPEGCQRGTHGLRTHAHTNTHTQTQTHTHAPGAPRAALIEAPPAKAMYYHLNDSHVFLCTRSVVRHWELLR